MIEPTDEMVRAFYCGRGTEARMAGADDRAGLAAVLAIVARDRCMEPKGHVYHPLAPTRPGLAVCGAPGPDGVTCERQPHSWIRGSLHGRADEENGLVQW